MPTAIVTNCNSDACNKYKTKKPVGIPVRGIKKQLLIYWIQCQRRHQLTAANTLKQNLPRRAERVRAAGPRSHALPRAQRQRWEQTSATDTNLFFHEKSQQWSKNLLISKPRFLLVLHVLPQPKINSICHNHQKWKATLENLRQTGLRFWLRHFAV